MSNKLPGAKQIASFFVVLLTHMGCTEEVTPSGPEPGTIPIRLHTTVSTISARNNETAKEIFSQTDSIGLYVVQQPGKWTENAYLNNVKHIFSENGFIPETTVFYPAANTLCDFLIYYPYQSGIFPEGMPESEVSVEINQADPDNYRKSNFMTGITRDITPSEEPVKIELSRKFTGINLLLKPGNVYQDMESMLQAAPSVKIKNCFTSALYNIETEELSEPFKIQEITPYTDLFLTEEGVAGISAIIIPQKLEKGEVFIELNMEGKKYEFAFEEPHTFNPDTQENLILTLSGKNSIGAIDVEVSDWNNENSITGDLEEKGDLAIDLTKMDFELSAVWQVYYQEKPIAEICREYLLIDKTDKIAIVFYPISDNETDLTQGTVLWIPEEEQNKNGGKINWKDNNNPEYEEGDQPPLTSFYMDKEGKISFKENNAVFTEMCPYQVADNDQNLYGVVKTATQYWMNRNFQGTTTHHGTQLANPEGALGETSAYRTHNRYFPEKYGCFYNWEAVNSGILPEGWRLPETEDWTRIRDYTDGTAALKEPSQWENPDYGRSGLALLPSLYIEADGTFIETDEKIACFWISSGLRIGVLEENSLKGRECTTDYGFNIRCLRE